MTPSCFFAFASRGWSWNASGMIGRSAIRHFWRALVVLLGLDSSTRWPTAHVITYSSDSRKARPPS